MPLKQNALHEAVLVHRPPEPVLNIVHARADLVERPPGTPLGFPVAQIFSEEGPKLIHHSCSVSRLT